ncbi:MAG: aminotransferase class IV, partial [Bacteroidota bacterium]
YLSNNWETSRFSLTLNPFNPVPEKVFENSGILSTRLFSKNSFSAFKTLNALPYIELSREANQKKWETGIALNEFDEAVDACWHSFGIFQENEIILPEYSRGGIWSCGAMALEEYLSQINTSFQRKCIKALELETCQEIFFINALDGIVPLRIWNNSKKSIELSKKLAQGFNTFYYF